MWRSEDYLGWDLFSPFTAGTEGLNSGRRACHCTPASPAERLHWPLLCHYTGDLR